jgi:hypothetical protein
VKNTLVSLACASIAFAGFPAVALAGPARGTPTTIVTLQPNYSARLDHRLSWSLLPIRVFFVPDKHYTVERERIARAGFDHWTRATTNFIRYSVTRLAHRADIFVRFNPTLNGGLTKTHFRKGRLFRADMTVGVAHDEGDDIECTAAHEFGHALGIDGHSDDRDDLMYPVHVMGRSFGITERDVNTLASAYPALAKILASQVEAKADRTGPSMMY